MGNPCLSEIIPYRQEGFIMNVRIIIAVGLLLVSSVHAETTIPQTIEELWADFPARDKATPLETEILKTWEEKGVMMHLVRFTIGTFRGEKLKLAGFYAYPKGEKNLPALIQCHGGGQKASTGGPLSWALNGYATFCPNNGAQPWGADFKGLPNTDYGSFNPGIRKPDKRYGEGRLAPGQGTVDNVVSPRNEPMYLRMVGMRRALTFLQSRPEVNAEKLGFRGHSTGGVMTVRTATDARIKAAVPSMGGCGFWWDEYPFVMNNNRGTAGMNEAQQKLFLDTVSCDANWKVMQCSILFLGASNDFNSATENVVRALKTVPHDRKRLVLPAHYNHSSSPEAGIADEMWFEHHLKGTFIFPETPEAELILETKDHVPVLRVKPDPKSELPIRSVDVYYSYERQPMLRFWADGMAAKKGETWEGRCPIFYEDEPLFAYANVTYGIEHNLKAPNVAQTKELLVTSSYHMATPDELTSAGVKPIGKPDRLIDDFSRGLHDWTGHLNMRGWKIETRKLVDPRWMGPKGGELVVDVKAPAENSWIGVNIMRRFRGHNNGEYRYYAYYRLPEKGWNTLRMKPEQFENNRGEKLDDWHKVTNLIFQDADFLAKDHRGRMLKAEGKGSGTTPIPSDVSGWDSSYYHSTDDAYATDNVEETTHKVDHFRNLRWEGGEYIPRPKHYEED